MAFIRRVRTGSGATAVQIAEYVGGRQRIVKHLGSAHTEAELGVLLEHARELLADPGQAMLEMAVEPTVVALSAEPDEPGLFAQPVGRPSRSRSTGRDGTGRVLATGSRVLFDALAGVYANLGFDVVNDSVFRGLVIARMVEPTSLLDTGRVLTDLGQDPASYSTMKRTLRRVIAAKYRDQIATACFAHATTAGDVSLCLVYDGALGGCWFSPRRRTHAVLDGPCPAGRVGVVPRGDRTPSLVARHQRTLVLKASNSVWERQARQASCTHLLLTLNAASQCQPMKGPRPSVSVFPLVRGDV